MSRHQASGSSKALVEQMRKRLRAATPTAAPAAKLSPAAARAAILAAHEWLVDLRARGFTLPTDAESQRRIANIEQTYQWLVAQEPGGAP